MLFDLGECCNCTPAGPACYTCTMPTTNLKLSYANSLLGGGTATLVYDGVGAWATAACVRGLLFDLSCVAGTTIFRASYFTGGPCPTGTRISCSSPGLAPQGLTLAVAQCSPLMLRWTLNSSSCPTLGSQGYTSFTVTL